MFEIDDVLKSHALHFQEVSIAAKNHTNVDIPVYYWAKYSFTLSPIHLNINQAAMSGVINVKN